MLRLYTIPGQGWFAAAYGAGTYNSGTYSCTSASTCPAASNTNGGLVNTGIAVGAVVTLACIVLLVAVVVRFWKRPANKPVQQEDDAVETTSDDETELPKSQL